MQNDLLKEVLKNYHIPINARIWRGRRAPAWIVELSHFADLLSLWHCLDDKNAEVAACLLYLRAAPQMWLLYRVLLGLHLHIKDALSHEAGQAG